MSEYTKKHAEAGLKAKLPKIDTFQNQYKRDYEVTYENPEFTSVCPKTGLPDFGKITIRYCPKKLILELKSLKMYMLAYRVIGIFQENAVNRILDDIVSACKPKRAEVIGEFNPRGGIATKVIAKWPK
ncbi:MAG: preQ(1) synthase [Candidatus Saganbacteria bacterium]|nr:preQ(1) synthase [Candidatus Saganbacteria bacterium]